MRDQVLMDGLIKVGNKSRTKATFLLTSQANSAACFTYISNFKVRTLSFPESLKDRYELYTTTHAL
jgi:hypothetical protein